MTPEEKMQRNMEFIVEQQAQFVIRHEESEKRLTRLEKALVNFANESERRHRELDEKMAALADAQIRTEDRLQELTAAQVSTDQRLNAFINVVEGLISSGQNGKRITARGNSSKKASKKRGKK